MYWLRGKHQVVTPDELTTPHAQPRAIPSELDAPDGGQQPSAHEQNGVVAQAERPAEAPHQTNNPAETRLTDSSASATPVTSPADPSSAELIETYEIIVTYESSAVTVFPPAPEAPVHDDHDDAPPPVVISADGRSTLRLSQDHDQLYARNWAFIDAGLQAHLAETTLFAAGTGLGSLIATLAVRTGFTRFILADGDQVENTNLNRQAFERGQLGQNKAISTAEQIRRIQPHAQIEVIPRFVEDSDFPGLIERSDLIVNTIDFSSAAFLSLSRLASMAGKPVLFPVNLGWGGALLVFTRESATLEEFAGLDPHTPFSPDVVTRLILRVIERIPDGPPPYIAELLARYASRTPESWPYDPQLGVGTHITASLVVQAAVSLVAGWPVRTAPDLAWCDARVAMAESKALAPHSP